MVNWATQSHTAGGTAGWGDYPCGWSDVAACDGVDTTAVAGNRVAGIVGRVRGRALPAGRPHVTDSLIGILDRVNSSHDPLNDLVQQIAGVHDDAKSNGRHGGATITALVRHGASVSVVHVGDASAVRLRHGDVAELTPLTSPHTVAAELRAAGRLPNARADTVLTRVIGSGDALTIDVTTVAAEPGCGTSFVILGSTAFHLSELAPRVSQRVDAKATLSTIRQLLPPDSAAIVLLASSEDLNLAASH